MLFADCAISHDIARSEAHDYMHERSSYTICHVQLSKQKQTKHCVAGGEKNKPCSDCSTEPALSSAWSQAFQQAVLHASPCQSCCVYTRFTSRASNSFIFKLYFWHVLSNACGTHLLILLLSEPHHMSFRLRQRCSCQTHPLPCTPGSFWPLPLLQPAVACPPSMYS